MIHLGDITKIDGSKIPVVDCITGGSPCQDLSVAGKREGLAGERSGLFIEQLRVVKEMRENDRANGRSGKLIRPRSMVWENVPGAFSSNKGADFQAVLTEIVKIAEPSAADVPMPEKGKWPKSGCLYDEMGAWSVAWRVHDAQFWGVPQRRKRISVVADFGGLSAPEVLFIRKGLSRDLEKSGEERQRVTGAAETSVDTTISFQERAGKPGGGKGILIQTERTGALSTFDNQRVYSIQGNAIDRSDTAGCNGKGWNDENVSYTLNTIDRPAVYRKQGHPQNSEQGQGWEPTNVNDSLNVFDNGEARTPTLILENHPADSRVNIKEDGVFQTLSSRMGTGGGNVPMVMEPMCIGNDQVNQTYLSEKVGALNCMDQQQAVMTVGSLCQDNYKGPNAQYVNQDKLQITNSVVRRLTPLECERLQGFPDNWTDIGEWVDTKGKLHKNSSGSARYKALGNSIALPFWFWLLRRISAQYERPATLGSLFDGIGGFPLCWERCNGEGTAIWASEIEEFPIAVTKRRFRGEK